MTSSRFIIVGALTSGLWTAAALAQQPQSDDLIKSLSACRPLTDTMARLGCYDRAADALQQAVSQKNVVLLDREDVRQVRRSLFGFNLPDLGLFGRQDKDGTEDLDREITATIASVSSIGYGKYVVRLEDGAVWRMTEVTSIRPEISGKVTIRKGILGAYILRVGNARGVKAVREK